MKDLNNIKASARRVDRMAQLRGVDLQDAAIRGDMRFDEIADAVLGCSECSNPGHCDSWMEQQGKSVVPQTPGYCRNADLFARLTKG